LHYFLRRDLTANTTKGTFYIRMDLCVALGVGCQLPHLLLLTAAPRSSELGARSASRLAPRASCQRRLRASCAAAVPVVSSLLSRVTSSKEHRRGATLRLRATATATHATRDTKNKKGKRKSEIGKQAVCYIG
jgi:hypothetical protein